MFFDIIQVTKQLGGVVQGLDKVMASMDLEKVCVCVCVCVCVSVHACVLCVCARMYKAHSYHML